MKVIKVIIKILGKITAWILYPFFWMLECVLAFIAIIFEKIEKMMEEDI